MGINPPPGKFPAKLLGIVGRVVMYEVDPKDSEYQQKGVGESGTLEWTPASLAPAGGSNDSSSKQS